MKTLPELVQERARQFPDREAFTFVEGDNARRWDYETFDVQARAVAAQLDTEVGEPVLVLCPPGLDYVAAFFGCLYAGALAVPVYPPEPNRWHRTLERVRAIAHHSGARVAVTTKALVNDVGRLSSAHEELRGLRWTNTGNHSRLASWQPAGHDLDSLAFLQYTSGSTGSPKGVVLTHRNLVENTARICARMDLGPHSRNGIWLPPYHDMGLIGGILAPVYGDFPASLMSPQEFLWNPMTWLRLISDSGATCSGGPNFAFELCLRRTTAEQRAQLDLSRWAVAFCGAEPIRTETVEAFTEAFAPSGFRPESFYPCYGLAEGTLLTAGGTPGTGPSIDRFDRSRLATGNAVPAAEGRALVGVGAVIDGHELLIVEPETHAPRPPERIGEIWLSGPSVAQGYWKAPETTDQTFVTHDGKRWLRTGDLGFLSGGELFVTGRLKDVLIVNGLNHHPQDIERTAEHAHPAIRPGCCAAFHSSEESDEVVVLVETRPSADKSDVSETVRQAIAADHGLSTTVVPVPPRTIPKTSSGKTQRSACRDMYLAGKVPATGPPADAHRRRPVSPRSEPERRVAAAVSDLLGVREVGAGDNFFELGGDSVAAARLAAVLSDRFRCSVSQRTIFEGPTIEAIARHVTARQDDPAAQPVRRLPRVPHT
jgi:acyl-CoA synthetase (AMP-forming)/AMP-acid ligase II